MIRLTMQCLSGFDLYSRWVPLFCYRPCCFLYVNDDVHRLISMRIPRFGHEKQEGLQQNKVTASLASIQGPGH